MRVGLILSGHDPEPHRTELCRPGEFVAMHEWFASLPKGAYPAVDEFAETSQFTPSETFATQLNDAANAHNPPDGESAEAVARFLDFVGLGYSDETVSIEDDG